MKHLLKRQFGTVDLGGGGKMGIITAYRNGEITEEEFKKIINSITFKEKVNK